MASLSIFSFVSLSLISLILYRLSAKKPRNLPPGPPGKLLIGNLHDLPPPGVPEYQHWLPHKDAYGPISSVSFLGQTLVLLHDRDAAVELLERRVCSSRPAMTFCNMCGYEEFVANQSYSERFVKHRRFIHQSLGTRRLVEQFHPVQRVEVGRLLVRALEEPGKLMKHFKTEAGAIILKITYGYSVERKVPDPLVHLIEQMAENFFNAIVPLAWVVDGIPALARLPDRLPGMSFKKTADAWREVTTMTTEIPYGFARQHAAAAASQPTLVSQLVENCTSKDPEQGLGYEDEKVIKVVTAAMYAGAAETTISSLNTFVLAMLKFPEVQRTAQEEIDRVIGTGRLPDYEDRESLPYVDALVKEALRWWPVAPLGVPHRTDEDIEFRGYFIPKSSIVVPGVWWFLHDPEVYRDPDLFDPTRFLPPRNEPDPNTVAFGFGRRICPGRFLADASIFLTLAQMLATFDMQKAVDADGHVIEPPAESTPGTVDNPKPFPYRLTPRSEAHQELIRSVEREYPWERSDAENLGNKDFLQRIGAM